MKAFMRASAALVLVLVGLPGLADDCPVIQTFNAPDVQTGEPVTFTWSYTGGAPQTQTLTGHDFDTPILMGRDTRSYTYTPSKPGMKHAQLAAGSACGTVNASVKYKVKQCNVVAPAMTVDQTSIAPGAVIQASVALKPGHTARWEVINGTASATTGSAITVTAGGAGTVTINAWVSRGNSCSVLSTATVEVVAACSIAEPVVFHPQVATADNWFYLFVENVGPGETFTSPFEHRRHRVARLAAAGRHDRDLVHGGRRDRQRPGTSSIQIQVGNEGSAGATVVIIGSSACSPYATATLPVQTAQQPRFTTYGVYVGTSTQFDVILDPATTEWHFENSFGDTMEIIGNPQPNVYTIQYTSTHGTGASYIRIYGTAACGQSFDVTGVMNVLPPAPTVTLTSAQGETCGTVLTATFTGAWWDGQTFTTNESSITRFVGGYELVYLYVFDSYGGGASSDVLFPEPKRAATVPITGPSMMCLGQHATVTADLPPRAGRSSGASLRTPRTRISTST